MKVTIIGSGVFGLAMAERISKKGHEVRIWTEKEDTSEINVSNCYVTHSFENALKDTKVVFILVASEYMEVVLNNMKDYVTKDMLLILGSKGILKGGKLLLDVLKEIIPNTHYGVISGPTFAKDLGNGAPLGFTLAVDNKNDYDLVNSLYDNVLLEYNTDLENVELLGVLKNAYAIGSGLLSGLEYGDSTRCLYLYKVLNEIKSIIESMGGNSDVSYTLAGFGDLVLTCYSENSRNFSFGYTLSKDGLESATEFLNTHTVEGYHNLVNLQELFMKKSIGTPILNQIYDIVMGNSKPTNLVLLLSESDYR